jgi:hypothetical protein
MWTNADEVMAFIEGHKDRKWEEGDRLVLPDIEQAYEVIGVRAFKRHGFKLFVDLEAQCAVEGCEAYLITSKEVHQWANTPYLKRCCDAHRGGFRTEMKDAWKTSEEIAARPAPVVKEKQPRTGAKQRAVLEAMAARSLAVDRISAEHIISEAVKLLPAPGKGQRDTRRQHVMRALDILVKRGRVVVEGDVVLL